MIQSQKGKRKPTKLAQDFLTAFIELPFYRSVLTGAYLYYDNDKLTIAHTTAFSLNMLKDARGGEFQKIVDNFFKKPTKIYYHQYSEGASDTLPSIDGLFFTPPKDRPSPKPLPASTQLTLYNNVDTNSTHANINTGEYSSLWAEYPTDITRVSPFFPVNKNSNAKKTFLENFVISAGNWGSITYSGPILTTDDESVLLSILAALDKASLNRKEEIIIEKTGEETKTYKYCGPLVPLFQYMGYSNLKNVSEKNRQSFLRSLKRLMSAVFTLDMKSKSTKISNVLSNVEWDKNTKELHVVLNPFFYESFCNGTTTLIDVLKRAAIAGNIAKSLYRFVQSQKQRPDKPVFKGFFITLADSLNMNIDADPKEIKKTLRASMQELIKHGILTAESQIDRKGVVTLYRSQKTFPKSQPHTNQ